MNFLASANWTIWQDVYVAVCYHNLLSIECENLATNISSLSSDLASVCVSVCVCQCMCVCVCVCVHTWVWWLPDNYYIMCVTLKSHFKNVH